MTVGNEWVGGGGGRGGVYGRWRDDGGDGAIHRLLFAVSMILSTSSSTQKYSAVKLYITSLTWH